MRKLLTSKKLYKKVLILSILLYVTYVFVSQQKTLDSYRNTEKYYIGQIDTKKTHKDSLVQTKANIDSKEYIENIAREKLDMYLPNERVYVDKAK